MNTQEIKKMSRIERLQTMEALWDSLIDEESAITSPEWHRDILEERKRKIEADSIALNTNRLCGGKINSADRSNGVY